MNSIRWFWLAPIFLALWAQPALAEKIAREYHETFDVEQGVVLRLDHGDGDVLLEPWDQDVIQVDVNIDIDFKRFGFGTKPDLVVEFDQRGREVRVREVRTGSVSVGFHSYNEEDYTYTIKAPAYTVLDFEGDDGDVSIADWAADFEIDLEDGDLELLDSRATTGSIRLSDGDCIVRGFEGELIIESEDGDVLVSGSNLTEGRFTLSDGSLRMSHDEGNFEIETEDGDVELRDVTAGRLEVMCEDGEVDLDLIASGDVDWDIETEDGDVELSARDVSAEFTIDTDDGRIRVDLPDDAYDRRENRVSGTLGAGDGKIRIRVSDGSVTLRQS